MNSSDVCVYTCLIGDYETLNEQPVAADSQIEFICFTDNENLESDSWKIIKIDPILKFDPIRSQRHIKLLPNWFLPSYKSSIYIDNSVILKCDPSDIISIFEPGRGIMIPSHSFRKTVLDEFLIVAREAMDDLNRVFEQLNHYFLLDSDVLNQAPFWGGFIVRDHECRKTQMFAHCWKSHVDRYSRRDQLSLNFCISFLRL